MMKESEFNKKTVSLNEELAEPEETESVEKLPVDEKERLTAELKETNDKYLRLYAEFENYKKKVNKDKEELVKYGNEKLIYELLPVIDNLEMALEHSKNEASESILQGVEITLKELMRILQKFELTPINSMGKPFDPAIHHAMTLVERDDIEENIVVEEFRKGYMFRDKVIRASLVGVSKKPAKSKEEEVENEIKIIEEES
ncbi:MAG TPA: nucleotide exchange factor GrpE [Thermodesulfovibrionales bacterium]|nr:nucleotide exchange factor GrpE [Thermodesulfovibrionales bacterium]